MIENQRLSSEATLWTGKEGGGKKDCLAWYSASNVILGHCSSDTITVRGV